MKFNDIKKIVNMEFLTIFETCKSVNILRKENWQITNYEDETKFDDYEVLLISGKADCELFIYLKKSKEIKEND